MAKTAASLSVTRIGNAEDLGPVRDEWNGLLERTSPGAVELSWEWQAGFWRSLPDGYRLYILLVRDGGTLVAVAPFMSAIRKRHGMHLTFLQFIAHTESNYQDFIVERGREEAIPLIWEFLRQHKDEWDCLDLTKLPTTSAVYSFFAGRVVGATGTLVTKETECLFLSMTGNWVEYLESIPKRLRIHLRRYIRRLDELGKCHMVFPSSLEEFSGYVHDFFNLHRKRWNTTATPSKFNDPRVRNFYEGTLREMYERGQVNLAVLRVGVRTIAILLLFCGRGEYLVQLTAYETDLAQWSPNLVLYELFLQKMYEEGGRLVDFGTSYPYKQDWARSTKRKVDLAVFGPGLRPTISYVISSVILRMKSVLRSIPFLRSAVHRIRGAL